MEFSSLWNSETSRRGWISPPFQFFPNTKFIFDSFTWFVCELNNNRVLRDLFITSSFLSSSPFLFFLLYRLKVWNSILLNGKEERDLKGFSRLQYEKIEPSQGVYKNGMLFVSNKGWILFKNQDWKSFRQCIFHRDLFLLFSSCSYSSFIWELPT